MGDPKNHCRTSTLVLFCLSILGASLSSHQLQQVIGFGLFPGGFKSSVLFAYGSWKEPLRQPGEALKLKNPGLTVGGQAEVHRIDTGQENVSGTLTMSVLPS